LQKDELLRKEEKDRQRAKEEEEGIGLGEFGNNGGSKRKPNEFYKDDYLEKIKDHNRQNYFIQYLKDTAKQRATEMSGQGQMGNLKSVGGDQSERNGGFEQGGMNGDSENNMYDPSYVNQGNSGGNGQNGYGNNNFNGGYGGR